MNIKDFKSLYIGGDKVKSIYISNTLIWSSEQPKEYLYMLQMGTESITSKIVIPIHTYLNDSLEMLQMGTEIIT